MASERGSMSVKAKTVKGHIMKTIKQFLATLHPGRSDGSNVVARRWVAALALVGLAAHASAMPSAAYQVPVSAADPARDAGPSRPTTQAWRVAGGDPPIVVDRHGGIRARPAAGGVVSKAACLPMLADAVNPQPLPPRHGDRKVAVNPQPLPPHDPPRDGRQASSRRYIGDTEKSLG